MMYHMIGIDCRGEGFHESFDAPNDEVAKMVMRDKYNGLIKSARIERFGEASNPVLDTWFDPWHCRY